MSEDAPVTDDGDDERQQHADDNEQDGVVIGGSHVPETLLSLGVETLLSLGVEPVRRPPNMVR